jgi:hypothetical protein
MERFALDERNLCVRDVQELSSETNTSASPSRGIFVHRNQWLQD